MITEWNMIVVNQVSKWGGKNVQGAVKTFFLGEDICIIYPAGSVEHREEAFNIAQEADGKILRLSRFKIPKESKMYGESFDLDLKNTQTLDLRADQEAANVFVSVAREKRPLKDFGALSVLDVGCGSGLMMREIASLDKDMTLVGVEVNVASVIRRDHPNVAIFDGKTLPFEDDSFDVVASKCAIEYLPYQEALNLNREMLRVAPLVIQSTNYGELCFKTDGFHPNYALDMDGWEELYKKAGASKVEIIKEGHPEFVATYCLER